MLRAVSAFGTAAPPAIVHDAALTPLDSFGKSLVAKAGGIASEAAVSAMALMVRRIRNGTCSPVSGPRDNCGAVPELAPNGWSGLAGMWGRLRSRRADRSSFLAQIDQERIINSVIALVLGEIP